MTKTADAGIGGGDRAIVRREARRELGRVISGRALIFIVVFLLLAVAFQAQSNGLFLTPRNLSLMLRQSAILAVVAAGVGVLMTMSEIDLSIGSSVFLCGVVAAQLATSGHLPLLLVVLLTVLLGVLLGAVQGVAVVVFGIPSFMATLAGLLAFRGLGLLWTNAATIGPVSEEFQNLSESFVPPTASVILIGIVAVAGTVLAVIGSRRRVRRLATDTGVPASGRGIAQTIVRVLLVIVPLGILAWIVGGFLGMPTALIWVAVIAGGLALLMTKTTYGRSAYLLGANREAAVYSGIRVKRNVFIGFLIMGALYAVGSILLTARLGSSTPGAGINLELDAIAAAVIGGISLRGGTGAIGGAVMGALLLTVIDNGMSILNVSSFTQDVVKAAILVVALGFDAWLVRRKAR